MCIVKTKENTIKIMKRSKKIIVVLMFLLTSVHAQQYVEFDNRILENLGFEHVDLSLFSGEEQVIGEYLATIELNSVNVARDYPLSFYIDDMNQSRVCFDEALLRKLAIKKSDLTVDKVTTESGSCYVVHQIEGSIIDFDSSLQNLQVTLPQKYLGPLDPNWVAPNERDNGINGLVLDYSALWEHQRYKSVNSSSSTRLRSYGTVGANIDRFRLRANYQYSSDAIYQDKFEWDQIYGFTDLGSINAKLYAGELFTRSNVFDGTRIKGVSIFSDEAMMPSYLRGYAPQITGIANSNAVVSVTQYGSVLRRVQVPSGPFVISDLPSYVNGTVTVEIEEANGEIRSYQVDVSSVPFLTRKGHARYSVNIGKISPTYKRHGDPDTNLVSADISYGMTSNLSLYGGTQFTTNSDYKAINIGIGANLEQFGALSFDVTQSENTQMYNTAGEQYKGRGHSYRFNYAKRFAQSTTLNIAGYRFSSRDFTTLNNYLAPFGPQEGYGTAREKNRVSMSISQQIPEWDINITGSMSKSSYWDQSTSSNYNIALNKVIREGLFTNTSVSFMLSQDGGWGNEGKDHRVGLYVSIPLGEKRGALSYGGSYSDRDNNTNHQMTYRNNSSRGNYSIGISTNHQRDLSGASDYRLNGSYSTQTGYGQALLIGDYSDHQRGLRASFDGSVTVTQHGIATHSRVYGDGSRLILDAGSPGVSMQGGDRSNLFGLIGVSNVASYQRASYRVNNDTLPENLVIQDGVVQVATSQGAIAYRSLGSISGETAIVIIRLLNDSYPPFGAVVNRENGQAQEVGIVAENGLTYLTGVKQGATYTVEWRGGSCLLEITTLDRNNINSLYCN